MKIAKWWCKLDNHKVLCELCPRSCQLKDGQKGFCRLRINKEGFLFTNGYESASALAMDPVEKKPLYHFLPGTKIISVGHNGCNLACRFCQNWHISREDAPVFELTQERILLFCNQNHIKSVAFTYNEPLILSEFILDCAQILKKNKIFLVLVSAGYISPKARDEIFTQIDAFNFDIKGFSEKFSLRYTGAKLQTILNNIAWCRENTKSWIELTHLVIPGINDNEREFRSMCRWIVQNCGIETPLHLSAFYPHYQMRHLLRTEPEVLIQKWDQAREEGLLYVYTGNIKDPKTQSTLCPKCNFELITRMQYQVVLQNQFFGFCPNCNQEIPGKF